MNQETRAIRKPLAPLSWAPAFGTAARTRSFLRAGEELAVPPDAASQKVKSLEAHEETEAVTYFRGAAGIGFGLSCAHDAQCTQGLGSRCRRAHNSHLTHGRLRRRPIV